MAAQKIPANAKKPTDRKQSATDVADELKALTFTFDHDGESYTSRPMIDVLTPGFMRRARKQDEMDFMFTALEALFDGQEDALAVLDSMTWEQFGGVSEQLMAAIQDKVGASPGE